MRTAVFLLWVSALAAGDIGQLQKLIESRRFFDLRSALDQPGWNGRETLFYRGAVACRFGKEADGIGLLREFLSADPGPDLARKAHEELASAFDRTGRYKEAAQEWSEALRLAPQNDPDREENENTRLLLSSLADVPPPSADVGDGGSLRAVRNKLGSWNVPVQMNGVTGEWIFDTGANISTISESEAKRMGLAVRDSAAYVTGSTGKRNSLRVAVAADLQCGAANIHNVIFLVIADSSLYIPPVHVQITGILGLPALRAFGRVAVARDGSVHIHPHDSTPAGAPNLFLDGESPIVEIAHGGHRLQMFLDTGANATTLFPAFRAAMTAEERSTLKTRKERVGGAGGVLQRKVTTVPLLQIEISGTAVNLKKLSLLPEMPQGDARYRDGVIGMDALWSGFLLDFDSMRLVVE